MSLATVNYSVYALLPAWFLNCFISTPRFWLITKGIRDNVDPRNTIAKLMNGTGPHSKKMSPAEIKELGRRCSAHDNGIENFPLFAATVILMNVARLSPEQCNKVALIYLVNRVIFFPLYWYGNSVAASYVKSAAYWTATGYCLVGLYQAGSKLA